MLKLHAVDGYLYFDEQECRLLGRELASSYRSASPFPHVVIEDFLDADILREVASSYPQLGDRTHFDRAQERFKYQIQPQDCSSGLVRNLFAELNGRAFLGFLEEMTGIAGLISDPYLAGGGLHLTLPGGHLGIHADFNIHGEIHVERRLNLLVYLNDDWSDEFGGKLELWDRDMRSCAKSIAPVIGRAVIFSTALDSYHGHPDPLACPPDRDRRSIATYYYTALPSNSDIAPHDTSFQVRPGSTDRRDWKIRLDKLIADWVPRPLQRYARRLNPFS